MGKSCWCEVKAAEDIISENERNNLRVSDQMFSKARRFKWIHEAGLL